MIPNINHIHQLKLEIEVNHKLIDFLQRTGQHEEANRVFKETFNQEKQLEKLQREFVLRKQ